MLVTNDPAADRFESAPTSAEAFDLILDEARFSPTRKQPKQPAERSCESALRQQAIF
jgi:hypothetical protein